MTTLNPVTAPPPVKSSGERRWLAGLAGVLVLLACLLVATDLIYRLIPGTPLPFRGLDGRQHLNRVNGAFIVAWAAAGCLGTELAFAAARLIARDLDESVFVMNSVIVFLLVFLLVAAGISLDLEGFMQAAPVLIGGLYGMRRLR